MLTPSHFNSNMGVIGPLPLNINATIVTPKMYEVPHNAFFNPLFTTNRIEHYYNTREAWRIFIAIGIYVQTLQLKWFTLYSYWNSLFGNLGVTENMRGIRATLVVVLAHN